MLNEKVCLFKKKLPSPRKRLPLQKTMRDVGQQSLFDCQRSLTPFDTTRRVVFPLQGRVPSRSRRNFSIQVVGLRCRQWTSGCRCLSAQVSTRAISDFKLLDSSDFLNLTLKFQIQDSGLSNLRSETSNLKFEVLNFKSQISSLKFQISNLKSQI